MSGSSTDARGVVQADWPWGLRALPHDCIRIAGSHGVADVFLFFFGRSLHAGQRVRSGGGWEGSTGPACPKGSRRGLGMMFTVLFMNIFILFMNTFTHASDAQEFDPGPELDAD